MQKKDYSRRTFIKHQALCGMGLFVSSALPLVADVSVENEKIIDIHQHTNYRGRSNDHLLAHQRAMGITTTILQPAGHAVEYGSTYYGVANGLQAECTGNEACYEMAKQYPQEFLFAANEVPDLPGAVKEIEKYLKLGAPLIGECKFGVECDSPGMQKIYELAQAYKVPVLQHWLYNMYNRGFERFYKMLEKYPGTNFIGHSQTWWANVDKDYKDQNLMYPSEKKLTPGGLTDRLLSDYPNMYGDLSAPSGLNFLLRDQDSTREFLVRHQDKLVFGSDCKDIIGRGKDCIGAQIIDAVRRLCADKKVERKLLYENAKKLISR